MNTVNAHSFWFFFNLTGSSEEHYAKNLSVQSMKLGFRYFSYYSNLTNVN